MNWVVLGQTEYVMAALVIGALVLGCIIALGVLISHLMVVGNPSELLVISGRRAKDGQGYRTLIGGRTLVIPILEKAARLSLRNMQVGWRSRRSRAGARWCR